MHVVGTVMVVTGCQLQAAIDSKSYLPASVHRVCACACVCKTAYVYECEY